MAENPAGRIGTGKTLAEMTGEVYDTCVKIGWYDDEVPFPQAIALLHAEASEALEAYRRWGVKDATKIPEEWDGNTPNKPEGVGSEFADLFIRLLDYCRRFGVDLEFEYERKAAYNRTREYRHGGKLI